MRSRHSGVAHNRPECAIMGLRCTQRGTVLHTCEVALTEDREATRLLTGIRRQDFRIGEVVLEELLAAVPAQQEGGRYI